MANTKKPSRKANMKPGDVIVTPTGAYEVNKDGTPIKMSEANRVRAGFPPGDTGMSASARQQTMQQYTAKKKQVKTTAKRKKK